jgi:basic amino acid/polyamine antiporter, APA family
MQFKLNIFESICYNKSLLSSQSDSVRIGSNGGFTGSYGNLSAGETFRTGFVGGRGESYRLNASGLQRISGCRERFTIRENLMKDTDVIGAGGDSSDVSADFSGGEPRPALSLVDAVALIVGIVIGAGIFSFPSLVAGSSSGPGMFLAVWLLGGVVSLIGVLCYAELASAFPSAGGDYTFLKRAFGPKLAFLFAWARLSVIQTGSVAILAFIFGDYATQLYSLGEFSPMLYAALIISVLTIINIIGIRFGTGVQKLLTGLELLGILTIIGAGFFFAPAEAAQTAAAVPDAGSGNSASASLGMAMIFVLLTFGGWNEAAYISSEMKRGSRQIAKALIIGICIITGIYILINYAYLNVLGLGGVAASQAVAGDVIRLTLGEEAAWLIGLMVAVAALTSANATIFTGARTNYALGRDFAVFAPLGRWNEKAGAPVNAFIVQGAIALALVALGMWTRKGISTIVDYTAPVFWVFFLLVGISLFVLRYKEPDVNRPFRVPFYPVTPILFCLISGYLLYSSLAYTGRGALVGVGVLLVGALLLAALPTIEGFMQANTITKGDKDEVSTI